MTIRVHQLWGDEVNEAWQESTIRLPFQVVGTESRDTARAVALSYMPMQLPSGHFRHAVNLAEEGFGVWKGEGIYSSLSPFEWQWEADSTSQTFHATHSLQTIHNYPLPGEIAPNFHGAIGVTDSAVEGTDIVIPTFSWSETHDLPKTLVTWSYVRQLRSLTAHTNTAAFRGFGPGEVLFKGATGHRSSGDPDRVVMTYRFEADYEITRTYGAIQNVTKPPHHYLWFRFQQAVDEAAPDIGRRPTSAHVERMYDEADFSLLGIGTAEPSA